MAIDLPPALPPQLSETQQVQYLSANAAAYVRSIDGFELRVTGDHTLSTDELDQLFNRAKTSSQAILFMNAALYNKGRFLIRFLYSAPSDGVIFIHAVQNTVGTLRGASAITGFFGALEGEPDLTRREFETPKVLAKIHADRTGKHYDLNYEVSSSQSDTIDLVFVESDKPDHDASDLIFQLGNQGSRFVGRYFADVGVKHDFANGTELSAGYETAITEWGESRDGDDYHQFQAKLDHPFRYGLYGVEAGHTEYERDLGTVSLSGTGCAVELPDGTCLLDSGGAGSTQVLLDAEIDQLAVTGSQVLMGDVDRRITLSQRLEWTDSQIDANTGAKLQDERYVTAALGATYHRGLRLEGKVLNWKAGATLNVGLSGDSGTLGTDTGSAGVSVGKRTAEFFTINPRFEASYELSKVSRLGASFIGQFADEQLPQQQQWILGGMDKMSAYLPGVVAGDTGYYLETHYRHAWDLGFIDVEAAVFAEYGTSQYENASGPGPGGADLGKDSRIVDAGVRVTARALDWLEVRAVIAEPISESNIDKAALERAEADFFVVVKAVF